jgi:predicted PurR-regulated permease PerM
MRKEQTQLYFFFVLFIGTLILTFFMFLPFLSVIALAALLAVTFYPLHRRILRTLGKRESLAAACTLAIATAIVVLPLAVFSFFLFLEARDLYIRLSSNGLGEFAAPIHALEGNLQRFIPGFELDVRTYSGEAALWLSREFGAIFAGTASALLALFLGNVAFYYFIRDGTRFLETIKRYSPLEDAHDVAILDKLNRTIHSVINGALTVALIQGILMAVGLVIFGVPNPALWGGITAIAALIPIAGTGVVLVPAVAYLALTGAMVPAVGLLVWGVVIVGLVDNILRPRLVGRGVKIHPLLIIFAVFGGLAFFGPIGFLLGPLVMSMLIVLGDIYTTLVRGNLPTLS